MSCELCQHALEHGSWPQWLLNKKGTHCSTQYTDSGEVFIEGCHRTWTASREVHCLGTTAEGEVCHLHFTSDSIANRHRKRGSCLPLDEVLGLTSKTRQEGEKPVYRVVESTEGETTLSSHDVKPLKAAWA